MNDQCKHVAVALALCLFAGCDDSDERVPRTDGAVGGGGNLLDANADAAAPVDDGPQASDTLAADAASPDVQESGLPVCVPAAVACDGNTITVCSADGLRLARLACDNGCDSTLPVAACKPAPLNVGWTLFQFKPTDDNQAVPRYVFEEDGLVAVQSTNSLPSAYVNNTVLENAVVKGRFSVETSADDDYIGFVFGWQDPQHFYLLRWKQVRQSYCGGVAEEGVSLAVVSSMTEVDKCGDFWASAGTDRVKVLTPASQNPDGWVDRTLYEFTLSHKPGNIAIEIREVTSGRVVATVASTDATYASGKFGFYNYSQQSVRYQFFSISLAP